MARGLNEKKKGHQDRRRIFLSLALFPSLPLYKAVYPSKPSLVSPRLFGSIASTYVCMYTKKKEIIGEITQRCLKIEKEEEKEEEKEGKKREGKENMMKGSITAN